MICGNPAVPGILSRGPGSGDCFYHDTPGIYYIHITAARQLLPGTGIN